MPIFHNIFVGLLMGMLSAIYAFMVAAFVFTGELAAFVPQMFMVMLVGSIIPVFFISVARKNAVMVSGLKSSLVPILGIMIADMTLSMKNSYSMDQIVATALTATILVTLSTGLFLWLAGLFKSGSYVRFLPYPVVCGFLAGIGALLMIGGFKIAASISGLSELGSAHAIGQSLLCLVFGGGLFWLTRRNYDWYVLVIYLLLFLGITAAILSGLGLDYHKAAGMGWFLFHQNETSGNGNFWIFDWMKLADFSVLADFSSYLVPIVLIALVSLLLDVAAIELLLRKNSDINEELKRAGIGNIFSGLGGGFVALQAAPDTAMVKNLGGDPRSASLVMIAVCLAILLGAVEVIHYIPLFIMGGFSLYIGLGLLVEWGVKTQKTLPRHESIQILLVMLCMVLVGVFEGVLLGLMLAILSFIIQQGRISNIKHELTGGMQHSRVDYSREQKNILKQYGHQIRIFVLDGSLFFGAASKLYDDVKKKIDGQQNICSVVMDFTQVDSIDASAIRSLYKICLYADQKPIDIHLCDHRLHLERRMKDFFDQEKYKPSSVYFFDTLQAGALEAEVKLLNSLDKATNTAEKTFEKNFSDLMHEGFSDYFEKKKLKANTVLFRKNQNSDEQPLYLLASGEISVHLSDTINEQGGPIWTYREGSLFGEMGLYASAPRAATCVVNSPSIVYELSRQNLQRMQHQNPDLSMQLHKYVVTTMAERVTQLNREIDTLL